MPILLGLLTFIFASMLYYIINSIGKERRLKRKHEIAMEWQRARYTTQIEDLTFDLNRRKDQIIILEDELEATKQKVVLNTLMNP